MKDDNLYQKLIELFEKYAKNSHKFSMAASSQSNESLNNIMAHKAPKNRCYSLSESADYRMASSVTAKNDGEKYILNVREKLSMPCGTHASRHAES